jgi:hypothetical protein
MQLITILLIFWFWGFAWCDDVLETAVGPIFNGHESDHKCAADWDATLYRGGVSVDRACGGQQGTREG